MELKQINYKGATRGLRCIDTTAYQQNNCIFKNMAGGDFCELQKFSPIASTVKGLCYDNDIRIEGFTRVDSWI